MKLSALLADCEVLTAEGDLDTDIQGIAYDSRKVAPGCVFVAIRGARTDGNRFISQAIAAGAAAVVSALASGSPIPAPRITVRDDRSALAALAANFYGHPTRKLRLVGVTGTNGKTTTTLIIESILRAAGHPAALFGTLEYRGPGFVSTAERTTPEAPDLEQLFRMAVDAGWEHAVMEVSSHAIALRRVERLHFEVAVFTNLTRDHLDFHGDLRSYFLAKKRLFDGLGGAPPPVSVLNADDPAFEELCRCGSPRTLTYGVAGTADIGPAQYEFHASGTRARYHTPAGELRIESGLAGTPNLYNLGAGIGAALALDVPAEAIVHGIERLRAVPGRFELVNAGQPFRVIVDYAHTDDALDKVLRFARELTAGRLFVVFGCGGDRDRTKRPRMGEVAGRLADFVVVTSDNPRSEDPARIIEEIEPGLLAAGATYRKVVDRRDAIREALLKARSGDTVVIAGKGHERYQEIAGRTLPFGDREVAEELLKDCSGGL